MKTQLAALFQANSLLAKWRRHALRWQQSRIPAGTHRLNARSVFIMPTRQGAYLGLFLIAMMLACINYNLSLGYLLTFFVFSVALGAMSRTHQNLLGVECGLLAPQQNQPLLFAGQTASINVQLRNTTKASKQAIAISFKTGGLMGGAADQPMYCSLASNESTIAAMPLACPQRGLHAVPALTLAGSYPLGLWRAWSYVFHLGVQTHGLWVFPAPRTPLPMMVSLDASPSDAALSTAIVSSQGDAVSHIEASELATVRTIHWPSLAKDQLAVRVLEDELPLNQQVAFGFTQCTVSGLEAQLEQLCAGVLHCQTHGIAFKLLLGAQHVPAQGDARSDAAHVQACLQALAQYE